ncbi:sugar isomerase [Enterococcus sp. JM4C]|uniref:MurR/RpiR family transcriptional regulator n=1 Tax=Candidatus Enterococcus huntleyi TaxID=1857217 RepID=UPI0013795EB8|nr:MurR/RpiR family transcriptional regulator [Enterococcus sp. JM4C]KAF1295803.1 sugar isomerase [Enterococcus sp. JM4C]
MLIQERMQKTSFSSSEQQVIDYLLAHTEGLQDLTIKDIAGEVYTHPSTLIRIAKKMGYSGWKELKEAYIEEITYLTSHFSTIDANFPFDQSDGVMSIASKIGTLQKMTIDDTLSLLHHDELQKAKQYLLRAETIKVFGSNANTLISQDFALKMGRLGKSVSVSTTSGEGLYEACNLPETSCAILISYTGENNYLLEILAALKEKNIPVIALTSIGTNQLAEKSNCALRMTTRERLYSKIGSFTINTSICYLLDVLYSCVFGEHYRKNFNHIFEVSQKVDNRRSSSEIIREGNPQEVLHALDSWIPN